MYPIKESRLCCLFQKKCTTVCWDCNILRKFLAANFTTNWVFLSKGRCSWIVYQQNSKTWKIVQLTLENSNTQFLELFDSTNKFFGPFFGTLRTSLDKQNSRYLEISNISVGRTKLLDPWTISSGSLKLSF